MSLYIGKLSPRIRRDDLEHVFRRFGRCIVKMKGEYGFVVYDSLPDARKALRALQGRNICGERLPITWSNVQPRNGRKDEMGARYNESDRGRYYEKGRTNVNGKSRSRRGGQHLRLPDTDAGKLNNSNMLDEGTTYHQNDSKNPIREQHHDNREDLEKNDVFLVDNQQNEQLDDISKSHGVDSGMEYERYDPSSGIDGKGEYYLGRCSSSRLRNDENIGMEKIEANLSHSAAPKSKLTCYKCGGMGHKMRECPEGSALQQKSSWVDRSNDDIYRRDGGKNMLNEYEYEAQGKLLSGFDSRSRMRSTRNISERAKSSSIIIESSPLTKEIHGSQNFEYEGRKRRVRNGDLRRDDSKRARSSTSSHDHSDNSESKMRSDSHSFKSNSFAEPHFRFRSVSNREDCFSSNSWATSLSHQSKSRSRASTPLSSSLSPSLQQPSSPSRRQFSSKGSMGNSIPLELETTLVEQGKTTEDINEYSIVEHGQTAEASKGMEDTDLKNSDVLPDNKDIVSPSRDGGCIENNHSVMAKIDNAVYSFSTEDEPSDTHLEMNGEDIVNTALQSHDGPGTSIMLEKSNLSDGNLSLEGLRGTMGQQKSGSPIDYVEVLAEVQNLSTQAPELSYSCGSTSISSEEMCMVLEHYGLDLPNGEEKNVPFDVYFGSARLWPWEMIYYRRLKKGPISVENYARRVAQNKEYKIVDRYIRSSSGWGELSEEKS